MMDAVFQRLADCMDTMGSEACEDGRLFGFRGFPQFQEYKVAWETPISREIGRRCVFKPRPRYPAEAVSRFNNKCPGQRGYKRMEGDLLIPLDGCIPLFVECKSIFECVLRKKSIKDIKGRCYRYDSSGENADTKHAETCVSIEQAWIDAVKLNCLLEVEHSKYHLGLLLLEFDRNDRQEHKLSNRQDYNHLERKLDNDNWFKVDRKTWPDKVPVRAGKGFQEHMVLWVKLGGNGGGGGDTQSGRGPDC